MTKKESRSTERHRTLKAGKIVFKQHYGLTVIDCVVRNVSVTGAAISVPNAVKVPEEFELRFDGQTRTCKVAWRRLERLGVKFE
jgi:hypothetical protein